jgi:hypothetical protein
MLEQVASTLSLLSCAACSSSTRRSHSQEWYLCRWWVLRGTALGGKVEWEETWWESSDWSGMKEMGAQKARRCA